MSAKNYLDVGEAMNHILRPTLAGFVGQKLSKTFGADWWRRGVLDRLKVNQKRNLPSAGSYEELTDSLDLQACLLLIDIHWDEIFSASISYNFFNYFKELQTIRNEWAHRSNKNVFDDRYTARALDTMILIAEEIDDETATKLRRLKNDEPEVNLSDIAHLPAWRDAIDPHPDVAQGRYSQAEWAVNLSEAVSGKGNAEYCEPVEFFSRTYMTDGLKKLLTTILRRVTDGSGEPIIQLKTSFGGGKTHSLLALYHLFGGIEPEQSAAIRDVLKAAGIERLPKVHTAVVVGTWTNPLKSTLWGEIAEQLALSTGKPELYEKVRENDRRGVSPGVALLKEIFNAAGACLVLIDELVAYGRKLHLGEIEDGGSFGNLMTFIQELTEAAKESPRTAVVVSIPESDAEIVDALGREVLNQVEKYFGRMEFVWTPVSVSEGYEIVRRRLFRPCHDTEAREKVCSAFFNMYCNNTNEFPLESRQKKYRERLMSCYPIHPKLFDFLYDRWTTLENFQKTRGVLRLMAKVIYNLWQSGDTGALIMPGDIPLDASEVRDELTGKLRGNWDAIVNSEIDGERSKPLELDGLCNRFGRLKAARKIARSIFMGTAPGSRKGERGVTENEIHLCTIQPQNIDNVANFNDALTKLRANLYYLYSREDRLWFSENPTVRKVFDEKREKYSDDDIFYEIEQRVKLWKVGGQFAAVHKCPKNSAEVPDEQTARLVILSPKYAFGQIKNSAADAVRDILENRGTVSRRWKNMLLFMSADAEKLADLKNTVRDFKAWSEVIAEKRLLNLDALQLDDAQNNLVSAKKNFVIKISQTYCKLLFPKSNDEANINLPLGFEEIECTTEDNISAASAKFVKDERLLTALGGEELRRRLDARNFIWSNDAVNVKLLWEYFAKFYYMPRLFNEKVLLEAIKRAVAKKIFALAADETFSDLRFGEEIFGSISPESFLVKAQVAQKFLVDENPNDEPEVIEPQEPEPPPSEATMPEPLPTKFFMDMKLDALRANKIFNDFSKEVLSQLISLPHAQAEIRLVVNVSIPEGVPDETKEIVEENCRVLRISNILFER